MKILYVSADLRRVGPTNQTLNIICNANDSLKDVRVLTLFPEPEETLKQVYIDKGINVESLKLRRSNFLTICKSLYKYLKQNSFEIVHSNGVKPDICLFFVSLIFKFTHVITLRNIPMEDAPTRMNKYVGFVIGKLHTFVVKHSKNVVGCSKTVCDVMKSKYGCNNIKSIQNGVDIEKFHALDKQKCLEELGLPSDSKILISTGSFIPRKHIDIIIEAFLKLKSHDTILVLLGEGVLFNELKKKYALNKNIMFKGLVSNITKWLSAADIFVSASDSEGLPNAVIEAIACNLPVILSDIPQHKEILEELPNCGEVFPLHNVLMLTKIIQNFSNRKTLNLTIASDFLSSPFTMKEMGNKYKAYYNKIGL